MSAPYDYLTTDAAAKLANVTIEAVRKALQTGQLKGYKFGETHWLIGREDFLTWRNSERRPGYPKGKPRPPRKPIKVVFLDLDGVLNSREWFLARGPRGKRGHLEYNVDPEMLRRLDRLCQESGARLVFSSTWRRGQKLWQVNAEFHNLGLRARFIGITPFKDGMSRGAEIKDWLARRKTKVQSFVILDDDDDMDDLTPRLVRTDHRVGLSDADVDKAVRMLGETK